MQKYFQFIEKDTKAQRNRIIRQLSQKTSQYMKQADSKRCPKHQPPWPLPTLGHGSFPHLSTWSPSTVTTAKWTSQQIQGSVFPACCRAYICQISSTARGTILFYSVLQSTPPFCRGQLYKAENCPKIQGLI